MDQTYLEAMNAVQTGLSDGKTVAISVTWTLGPQKSDALEIYASFEVDKGLPGPPLYATIDPSTKQPHAMSIPVIGYPLLLYVYLAPRLVSDGVDDPDMPDSEGTPTSFNEFAGSANFTIHYTPQANPVAVAAVTSIQPNPKTLNSANHFDIICTASGGAIEDFNLFPVEDGTDLAQLESSNGVFHQRSSPNARFTFKTQARNANAWGPWSLPTKATAADNLHSVSAFLGASGVTMNPPAHLKQLVVQYKASSLRNLLGI